MHVNGFKNIILEGYTSYLIIWSHIESLPKSFQKGLFGKMIVSHEMIFRKSSESVTQ